jgi:uncharacterized protein
VKFWDASAVVPLLVSEPPTDALLALLADDASMVVWWGTPVESASALARREREGALSAVAMVGALERLRSLSAGWHEVSPADPVRTSAQRLLRLHPLRFADALQLAAAILVAEHDPASLELVSLDERLNDAARREGFLVIRP